MLIEAHQLKKCYHTGHAVIDVLCNLDFSVDRGEVVGIFGASGAGKSTLLHLLGGLDTPSSGKVMFEGKNIFSLPEKSLAHFRNREVGFVFQFYHLLSEFTAEENASLPCLIGGMSRKESLKRARDALATLGLEDRFTHRPGELSGGEQQRVAMARAIVMEPPLLLADEPTGNLDRASGERVWAELLRLHRERGMALVVVTHNAELLNALPKKLELRDGKLMT